MKSYWIPSSICHSRWQIALRVTTKSQRRIRMSMRLSREIESSQERMVLEAMYLAHLES